MPNCFALATPLPVQGGLSGEKDFKKRSQAAKLKVFFYYNDFFLRSLLFIRPFFAFE